MATIQRKPKAKLSATELREAIESVGLDTVVNSLNTELTEGKLAPEQVSIRALWEGVVGPCAETLGGDSVAIEGGYRNRPLIEEVRSSAFTFATGSLITTKMMQEYEAQESALDQLVTVVPSNIRDSRELGFTAFGNVQRVPEGQQYPDSSFSEKKIYSPEPDKRGFMISITEETVFFDQTGSILSHAGKLGWALADDREREGLAQIQDLTDYKCYRAILNPDVLPTQIDLYRSSAGSPENFANRNINLKTQNALADWTDVDAARLLFSAMKDEADRKIQVAMRVVLIPDALAATASMIFHATEIRTTTNTDTQTLSPNVTTMLGGSTQIVRSNYLADSTTWYIGDPKRQFQERVLIPVSVDQLPGDPARDIIVRFRAKRKSRVDALDDKFFVKSTS